MEPFKRANQKLLTFWFDLISVKVRFLSYNLFLYNPDNRTFIEKVVQNRIRTPPIKK